MEINHITEHILCCAYNVSNTLGAGFLEKVYENALIHELQKTGLPANSQHPVKVLYDGVVVGDFTADILVEQQVLVELKAVKALDEIHAAQCINYLRATGLSVCLLLNFGEPKLGIRRLVNKFK